MSRCVTSELKGPAEVKPSTESQWICQCGLSKNQPFCDGSHKKTLDEADGTVYRYEADGTRKECGDSCGCSK